MRRAYSKNINVLKKLRGFGNEFRLSIIESLVGPPPSEPLITKKNIFHNCVPDRKEVTVLRKGSVRLAKKMKMQEKIQSTTVLGAQINLDCV